MIMKFFAVDVGWIVIAKHKKHVQTTCTCNQNRFEAMHGKHRNISGKNAAQQQERAKGY